MVRFDLGPLLQGQTRIPKVKVLITRLLLVLKVCNVEPSCRISWAGNLLMLLDLTFGPSFKVKRWFTGFGELSFWWIEICIGCPIVGLVIICTLPYCVISIDSYTSVNKFYSFITFTSLICYWIVLV